MAEKKEEVAVAEKPPRLDPVQEALANKPASRREKATMYFLGVIPRKRQKILPPFYSITVGGIAFCERTEDVEVDKASGETERNRVRGDFVPLTPSQVKLIEKRAAEEVVQDFYRDDKTGLVHGLSVVSKSSPSYTEKEGEIPVGRFLFMREAKSTEDRTIPEKPLIPEA